MHNGSISLSPFTRSACCANVCRQFGTSIFGHMCTYQYPDCIAWQATCLVTMCCHPADIPRAIKGASSFSDSPNDLLHSHKEAAVSHSNKSEQSSVQAVKSSNLLQMQDDEVLALGQQEHQQGDRVKAYMPHSASGHASPYPTHLELVSTQKRGVDNLQPVEQGAASQVSHDSQAYWPLHNRASSEGSQQPGQVAAASTRSLIEESPFQALSRTQPQLHAQTLKAFNSGSTVPE